VDLPDRWAGKISYQLLGSAANLLDFAIHEGDVLEYLHRLQSEHARRVRNLLAALRDGHLLLIDCRLPDWAGRSLLRLMNNESLQSKATLEIMADSAGDPRLCAFISRFSPNSLLFPGRASEFVAELSRRWQTARAGQPAARHAAVAKPAGSAYGPQVFVSYASQNATQARAIAERLLELGAGDVWLDKKKLRGGDDWSSRIEQAIEKCDYFLPLLSQAADARREGVFWEEWASALRRASRVADVFILPTLIDADPDSHRNYQRIGRELGSERFFQWHLLRAPDGVFTAEAEDDLGRRFAEFRKS